jgi:hypothetical protein
VKHDLSTFVDSQAPPKRLLTLAGALACVVALSTAAEASQPLGNEVRPAEPTYYSPPPLGQRYYGSIDPNPIGYYPYTVYQGPAFPTTRAYGYYPYPDAHPYPPPLLYPYGYYGGYGAWPYSGFPGWGFGSVYPYGFWGPYGYGF